MTYRYNPITNMNAARDRHRANGTSGKGKSIKTLTATASKERAEREASSDRYMAEARAVLADFKSWAGSLLPIPVMLELATYGDDEIPF